MYLKKSLNYLYLYMECNTKHMLENTASPSNVKK